MKLTTKQKIARGILRVYFVLGYMVAAVFVLWADPFLLMIIAGVSLLVGLVYLLVWAIENQ